MVCPAHGCYLTEVEGLSIYLGLLAAFACIGILAVPYIRKKVKENSERDNVDFWYTARNSQEWWSIALSICATSAGAWLLYTPGEAAYYGGWWAIIGYSVAIYLGPLAMCYFAPMFRDQMPDASNITDWVGKRFGRVAQLYVTLCLVYYMFIYLVGQLKTMGDMTDKFYGQGIGISEESPWGKSYDALKWGIVPVALATMIYTMVGGLPASIATDWIQAVCITIFVIVVSIACFSWVDYDEQDWNKVAVWSETGFSALVALCGSVFAAEVFNLAFWQRIYAAKDTRSLRIGFVVGGGMISIMTFLFGVASMALIANDYKQTRLNGNPSPIYVPAFAFFEILDLSETTKGIRALIYVLVVCMVASCADSFQTAITSIITNEVRRYQLTRRTALLLGMLMVVIVNLPAMGFALHASMDEDPASPGGGLQATLTDLFGMADIICSTLIVPVFAGLWPFATRNGMLLGMGSGILFILMWGWAEFGTFIAGLEMLTMMSFGETPPAHTRGLPLHKGPWYSWRAPIMFTMIPLVTFIVTYGVSFVERIWEKVNFIYCKLQEAPATFEKVATPEEAATNEEPLEKSVEVHI